MPKIRCHYLDCLFLDERYCSAAAIEVNPDAGCLTYTPNEEAQPAGWDDDVELDDWDEMESDEETEDIWASDDDDPDAEEDEADEY
ncbi:MAG: hypothetical protein WBI14_04040 [Anaerolineaceae bacterium]